MSHLNSTRPAPLLALLGLSALQNVDEIVEVRVSHPQPVAHVVAVRHNVVLEEALANIAGRLVFSARTALFMVKHHGQTVSDKPRSQREQF